MSKQIQVYLVPGFFGFTSLGTYSYFFRVGETLTQYLKEKHQLDVELVRCATQATSSIHRRAQVLLEEVKQRGGMTADSIHFIGHSTGGLDMRLLLSPGVQLTGTGDEDVIASKTKSAISISTPHYGTPLAGFFTTMQGRHILQLITTLAHHKAGRRSIFLISKLIALAARLDDWTGRDQTFLDHLVRRLLNHVTLEADDPIWTFLETMKRDQGAILQLTPESMHLYNAAVIDRVSIDYSCIVNAAPPPTIKTAARETRSPAAAFSISLFAFLHTVTAREHVSYRYPTMNDDTRASIERMLSFPISPKSNDGISPLFSQIHGDVLYAAAADHLDIVGQFTGAGNERFTDWLVSGAPFDETQFRQVWQHAGDRIAAAER
ncbi:MAG: hypothetical protein JXR76_18995 [Deltaproteobacteria bacterium]|nr:hypothetical protein [Deltaproteobacteria bacterium]